MKPIKSRRGPTTNLRQVKFLAYDGMVSLPRELIEGALKMIDKLDWESERIKVQVFIDEKRFIYLAPFREGEAKPVSTEASIYRVWKTPKNRHTVYFASRALVASLEIEDRLPFGFAASVEGNLVKIDTSRGEKIKPRRKRK